MSDARETAIHLPQQQQHPQRQQHQGLPSISSLTNGLPPTSQQLSPEQLSSAESARDSGTWPLPQSKHTSVNSGLHVHTLLNPDDSPSRNSVPSTPLSARIPSSAHSQNILPSINQGFQEAGNRESLASIDSRRSSVDSRMQHGFNSLYINGPTSPYESANNSRVSLAASLRQPNGAAPLSPLSGRSGIRSHPPPRIAPPIMPVGRTAGQPDPTASKPTAGFAWAFPDSAIPEERRDSDDSGGSSLGHAISRTNSLATSMRSSIFSTDSQMPQGQRRFDDGADPTTHHHSMQHRTVQSLQNDHLQQQAVGNYSRTPELRVSHKLAERKRRSEMKDLFEDLNKAVPSNGGTKASKWEILTKAIDYIRNTQAHEQRLHNEVQRLQRDSDYAHDARKENDMLKTEVQLMHQQLRRLEPNAPNVYGHYTSQLSQTQAPPPPPPPPPQTNGTSGISLPPLNSGSAGGHGGPVYGGAGPPPAAAMQGVEYGYNAR